MSQDVLAANQAFYDAFAARDAAAMESLWAKRAPVACIHPGWSPLHGRERVLASWRAILEGAGAPDIRCANAKAWVQGDTAFVVGYELLGGGRLVATNVFVREDGAWRLVLHQAGPLGAVDAVEDGVPPVVSLN